MGRAGSLAGAVALAAALNVSIAHAAEPTKASEEEARLHFSAGLNLLRDPARPRYEEAYVAFKKAYALVPSPKILGNLGLCAMKVERDAEAIDAFTRYLAEVPDLPAEERAQVDRDLVTLRATLATLTIETRPPGATLIDTRVPIHGDPVTNTYGPFVKRTELGVRKGHHVFKARFDGGREVTWEADVTGGETHVFQPAPAATSKTVAPRDRGRSEATERPVPKSVFVGAGVTAALGVGSLVTGLVAWDKHARFEERNDGYDTARAEDLRDSGTTFNVVADVLLAGAVIGAGVTAYLYFTRPATARPVPTRATAAAPLTIRF